MKINRLAVFAASLQYTDEVKVVSTGTVRTLATWGIWWLASAAEKDKETGGGTEHLAIQASSKEKILADML